MRERRQKTTRRSIRKKVFEKRRPLTCFNCRQPGHVAAGCRNPRVAFLSAGEGDVNMKLLEPYIREMTVNGKRCRVLRDSAATMDVVHPSYVTPEQSSGECAWIKQAVEANSVCLPIARICIEGPFGILDTEAAVSPSLPPEYPYLFSNRSEELLRQKGLNFGVVVQALTRSKARELAAIAPSSNGVAPSSQCMGESSTLSVKAPLPATVVEVTSQGSKLEEQPGDEGESASFTTPLRMRNPLAAKSLSSPVGAADDIPHSSRTSGKGSWLYLHRLIFCVRSLCAEQCPQLVLRSAVTRSAEKGTVPASIASRRPHAIGYGGLRRSRRLG
ncbi:uncharacterized protein LOC144164862 [Haemaphysalis longicornis]